MRSIRLSLLVYILMLLGLALGGVSWFVYQTSAEALRGQQKSTTDLILESYKDQVSQAKAALKDRILEKAEVLAKKARFRDHLEKFLPVSGGLATAMQPQGLLNYPLWYFSWNANMAQELYRMQKSEIVIEDADELILAPDPDKYQDQEYFQTYNDRGQSQQRSEKLLEKTGTHSLTPGKTLDKKIRDNVEIQPEYDEIEPEPGWKLYSVTIRHKVQKSRFTDFRPLGGLGKKGPAPKGDKGPGGKEGRMLPGQRPANQPPLPPVSVVYIQYASETSQLDQKLLDLDEYRKESIDQLEEDMQAELRGLRWRLLWISLATFAGIMAGGTVLIRLGLAPLARLSDAVSQISEKDFRLKMGPKDLPRELQPIAARLTGSLNQLQKAFAREKQAAADISHELRTPLAAMMTTVELSLRKSRSPEEYREMLGDIRSSGSQLAHLVERLLALARLDAGVVALRAQAVDARDIAKECTNMIRPLAEARGLALRLHAPEPSPLQTDPDKLREILNNLLHNAVEYNRPEGAIDLDVARVNGHLRLAVRDTGIGITPEQRDHLFERFYRADPSRHADTPHAGLGLAIVKSYVDLMGGTIGVDSDGRGSTFTIDLPVS